MKVFTTSKNFFYNSECLMIEYQDILSIRNYFLIERMCHMDVDNIIDLSSVKGFSEYGILEWYISRRHFNVFDNFKHNMTEEQCSALLNTVKDMDEIGNEILQFPNVLSDLMISRDLLNRIVVWNPYYSEKIHEYLKTFTNVEFMYGDFSDLLESIPRDTTYILSDIHKMKMIKDAGKLHLSSIVLADYRYNFKDNERSEPLVNIDGLVDGNTVFKIGIFNNIIK